MSNNKINKTLHQIWLGPRPAPIKFMETWRTFHPNWEHRLWTERNLPALKNQALFDVTPTYHGKADILRYEILHAHGGVYVDADSVCVMPIDQLLTLPEGCQNFAAYEHEQARPGLIANGALGAPPGSRLMEMLIDELNARYDVAPDHAKTVEPWVFSGPLLLTEMVNEYKEAAKLHVYPSHYFYPTHLSGLKYEGDGPIFAHQFWASSLNIYDELLK